VAGSGGEKVQTPASHPPPTTDYLPPTHFRKLPGGNRAKMIVSRKPPVGKRVAAKTSGARSGGVVVFAVADGESFQLALTRNVRQGADSEFWDTRNFPIYWTRRVSSRNVTFCCASVVASGE
jgi:hypothetical protein